MTQQRQASREVQFPAFSGWPFVFGIPAVPTAVIWWVATGAEPAPLAIFGAVASVVIALIMLVGFFVVSPNNGIVLVLFGRYRGTVRTDGFYWTNPFTWKKKVSLKAYNVASETIKVNDLNGNPIEIGAVVVWQVADTAQAMFDVESYTYYVDVQIETAVRHLASQYPYDAGGDDEEKVCTLRGDADQVSVELEKELQSRLIRAGITVLEARLSHLAYAPEIAAAMLQRQQAAAIIAARRQIVDGAVGMVEHALAELGRKQVVVLDDERKATLVGNLLVVLCSHENPTPVLNTGSLYT